MTRKVLKNLKNLDTRGVVIAVSQAARRSTASATSWAWYALISANVMDV